MKRSEFLQAMLGSVGALVALACGGSSNSPPVSGGNCVQNGTQVSIANNHGHALVVSKADVAAGVDKTYDIQGTAGHTHSVTFTAADFAQLAKNVSAGETSTVTLGHQHSISVSCS